MPGKVLIITYYWPPAGGPGVQRILKFSKYLPAFGWEPVVLTTHRGTYPSLDPSLENDVPPDLKVVKTKTSEPFGLYNYLKGSKKKEVPVALINMQYNPSLVQRLALFARANFFIPDARRGWNKYAKKAARRIMENEKIDAIITTGPPHSTHLIGAFLKKHFDLPWIADLRDPWTNVFYNKMLPRLRSTVKKDQKLEDKVLKVADCISVIGSGLAEEFQDRARRTAIIYNGFDEEDIPEIEGKTSEKFVISYIGNFKSNQNVPALWEALAALSREQEGFKGDAEIHLTGNIDRSVTDNIQQTGLKGMTRISGYVPHEEATKKMVNTNLLVFVIPQAPGNHRILTGKLFEYLASRTYILAIGPTDGNAAEILTSCDRKPMIHYKNKDEMKSRIRERYLEWKEQGKENRKYPANEALLQFSRKNQTKLLARELDQLV